MALNIKITVSRDVMLCGSVNGLPPFLKEPATAIFLYP
jgi:hypothetical protein